MDSYRDEGPSLGTVIAVLGCALATSALLVFVALAELLG